MQRASQDYLLYECTHGASVTSPFTKKASQPGRSNGGGSSHSRGEHNSNIVLVSPTLAEQDDLTGDEPHNNAIKIEKQNDMTNINSTNGSANYLEGSG